MILELYTTTRQTTEDTRMLDENLPSTSLYRGRNGVECGDMKNYYVGRETDA